MERQAYNRKILDMLRSNLTEERLRVCDVDCTPEEFKEYIPEIEGYINTSPDLRWCQILWIMNLNFNPQGPRDRFHEESITTFKKLTDYDSTSHIDGGDESLESR